MIKIGQRYLRVGKMDDGTWQVFIGTVIEKHRTDARVTFIFRDADEHGLIREVSPQSLFPSDVAGTLRARRYLDNRIKESCPEIGKPEAAIASTLAGMYERNTALRRKMDELRKRLAVAEGHPATEPTAASDEADRLKKEIELLKQVCAKRQERISELDERIMALSEAVARAYKLIRARSEDNQERKGVNTCKPIAY